MKKICFGLFFLTSSFLQAQNATLQFSGKFSLRDRGLTQKDGATFKAGDFYYCTETDYKGMQFALTAKMEKIKYAINIYKFDKDMKELQKFSLEGGAFTFGPFPPKSVLFRGKILLFYYNVLAKGAIQLLYSVLDPESLSASPGKELYTISDRNVGLANMEKAVLGNRLLFYTTSDSSSLLVSQSGKTNELFSCVIGKDFTAGKSTVTRIKGNMENFDIHQVAFDNAGNKYFTYSITEDKLTKNGLLVQNTNGKEAYLYFKTTSDGLDPAMLLLKVSDDNTKVYVYGASIGEFLEEGVMLATVDAAALKLGKPQIYAYPQELKIRLAKMDYGDKKHGNFSVKKAFYLFNELADGTIALTGFPINTIVDNYTDMNKGGFMTGTYIDHYAGPIINIFIKDGQCRFGVIYRSQEMTEASNNIAIPFGNKLVCYYTDSEKSIASDDPHVTDKKKDHDELVLAVAVIGSDGTVVTRKKLTDKSLGNNFFMQYCQHLSGNTYMIPVGRHKMNAMRPYTELEHWAFVDVN